MPGCRPGVVAAGPRDQKGGSRGTRTHKRPSAATCFQDRLLIRPDDFRISSSSGGWNRTNGLLVQSQASLPTATTPESIARTFANAVSARGEGFEPPPPGSKPGGLPLADPRMDLRVPCESRTRLSSLEGWRLCRSAKSTSSGRRGSRTLKAHRSTVFETAAVAHRLALPYPKEAAVAGIEPAKGRLTGACLYQHRPHRNESEWQDLNLRSQAPRACAMPGFATLCNNKSVRTDLNRRSRAPEARGIPGSPTHRFQKRPAGVEPAHPPWQGSRLPLHHGRIESLVELSKNQEHRVGLEPTSPHYGCGILAAGRPVLFSISGTRGARTLTDLVKSQACCR